MPFFANKFPYLSRVSDKTWASSVPEWMEKEANSRAVLCHKRKGNWAGELLWSNKIHRGRGGPGDQLCRCLSWAISTCLMLELETFPQQWTLLLPYLSHILNLPVTIISLSSSQCCLYCLSPCSCPSLCPSLAWCQRHLSTWHSIPISGHFPQISGKGKSLKMTIKGLES